ncbi:beta-galactosidase [Arthrobacter sp. B0490]|uniref:beta-galactosidase n=1 Tax=Arthrobacter sp. B0490 TaxID=2058891 RepID=UPI001C66A919|nr:beta-galactosidase [Arthrobacter sp. B0490]
MEKDGLPVIPVSGEMHYSRVPRDQWRERLNLMKAGGITVVATYVFWLHHEPRQGAVSFADRLDLAAFILLCEELDLAVVVRIGPWCHGEVRNGGFPDWVLESAVHHRTDDPAYLALVAPWLREIGRQINVFCRPGGPVLAIQLENELYDQPGHISTLKEMAIHSGITAPLWTATAWGGADLPLDDVVPLFGGYGDGFWVDADQPWDPTFRAHYFYSHDWDDPGIGADLRTAPGRAGPAASPYPPATCELGGGMATAYHRRPRPDGLDIAAVAHNKIGSGSAWQGYYMYSGGTNPSPRDHAYTTSLQESQDTGYPNDLPRYDYDFHAPVGASGRLAPSHAHLRRQHAFLDAFGALLAPLPSRLPDVRPSGVDDTTTLRWAVRSNGRTAFVFITWHQPHEPLPPYAGARFSVMMDGAAVEFPPVPLEIPAGTIAHWPVGLVVDGIGLEWATASPLTVLRGEDGSVLVLTAEPGVPVAWQWADGITVTSDQPDDAAGSPDPGSVTELRTYRCSTATAHLDVVVLPAAEASRAWVLGSGSGRQLLLSDEPLWLETDGTLHGRSETLRPGVLRYTPSTRSFTAVRTGAAPGEVGRRRPTVTPGRPAGTVPPTYGTSGGRASAPSGETIQSLGATYEISLPSRQQAPTTRRELEIRWTGDCAHLAGGAGLFADRFWDGSCWIVDLDAAPVSPGEGILLTVLPLHEDADVHLPADARPAFPSPHGQRGSVESVTVVTSWHWTESIP